LVPSRVFGEPILDITKLRKKKPFKSKNPSPKYITVFKLQSTLSRAPYFDREQCSVYEPEKLFPIEV
jgi:hypothetical protein